MADLRYLIVVPKISGFVGRGGRCHVGCAPRRGHTNESVKTYCSVIQLVERV